MTTQAFRRNALKLAGATEKAHMNHPDFRVNGKIFATLGYPDEQWGMVKLTPEQQTEFVRDFSKGFQPVKGSWGRAGSTQVRLAKVDTPTLRKALRAAWKSVSAGTKPPSSRRRLGA